MNSSYKNIAIWSLIFLFVFGYVYLEWRSITMMDSLRDHASDLAGEYNEGVLRKEEIINEFYKRADIDLFEGVDFADSIIEHSLLISYRDKQLLQGLIGEVLYDSDSISLALKRFELLGSNPKNQANLAGCYAKTKEYKKAMKLIDKASNANYDFKWLKGNLYEVLNERRKAIEIYKELYVKDKIIYSFCLDRVLELEQENSKLLEELIYRNRRKRFVFLFEAVD